MVNFQVTVLLRDTFDKFQSRTMFIRSCIFYHIGGNPNKNTKIFSKL